MTAAVVETQKNSKLKNTLKLDFKFDSMTLVLYSPNGNEVMHTYTYTHTVSQAQMMFEHIKLSLSVFILCSLTQCICHYLDTAVGFT